MRSTSINYCTFICQQYSLAVQNPSPSTMILEGFAKLLPTQGRMCLWGGSPLLSASLSLSLPTGAPNGPKMLSQLGSERTMRPSTTRRALNSSYCKGCGGKNGRLKAPMPRSELGYKTTLRSWLAHHITRAGSMPVKIRRFA